MPFNIALMGEAEKGRYCYPYFFCSMCALMDTLGNPPDHTSGIYLAIKALYYDCFLLFFRVEEEGFSINDYFKCFNILENKKEDFKINALSLPGVGNDQIIEKGANICEKNKSILILTEKDLYDYLTSSSKKRDN